jgi:ferredoxin-NADP reductase
LALSILRRHRAGHAGALSPFVLPSFLFAVTPWLWPSMTGLAIGFTAHLAWFAICELVAPSSSPVVAPARSSIASTPAVGAPRSGRPESKPISRQLSRPVNQFVTTSVLAVLDEADEIKTFRLLRPDGFDFVAGQFLPVRVRVEGKPHVRCYSISSAPHHRGYLEISVRRQGLVSTLLHATLRTGAAVTVGLPAGTFVYPAVDDRPIALVAGGIGVTPLLSMLRHAVASDPSRPITLLYSARTERDIAFLNELRVIAERHPQVRIGITLTRPSVATPWRTGRVDLAMVQQYVPHPEHSIFCICGPSRMIADTTTLLAALGIPAAQIRSERFELAVAATALTGRPAAEHQANDSGDERAGWKVTFALSGRTATAAGAQTLLELAESEGIDVASSCRSGVCQACRTRICEGTVDCQSDVLDPDDRAAGYVLPCVSRVTSDCVMEA